MKKKSLGFTLLEITLVIVVGGALLFVGLKQYQVWTWDRHIADFKYNVDAIFQGMTKYYYSHCSKDYKFLDKNGEAFAVKLSDLVNEGYIQNLRPDIALVAYPDIPEASYELQFNPYFQDYKDAAGNTVSTVLVWTMQVTIYPSDYIKRHFLEYVERPGHAGEHGGGGNTGGGWNNAPEYVPASGQRENWERQRDYLGADCMTRYERLYSDTGTGINHPCRDRSHPMAAIPSWERTPSSYNIQDRPDWLTMPYARQFNYLNSRYLDIDNNNVKPCGG